MSHMTADLEYFKCDMCGIYMHRDIYCDHRRDCHGRDSAILKRGECARLTEALGRETRELLLAKESKACATNHVLEPSSSGSSISSRGAAPCDAAATASGSGGRGAEASLRTADIVVPTTISASVSAAELERRQEAQTRRAVSDRYQTSLDAKIGAMLTDEKRASLMSLLKA